jgi:hypothetical protein
MLTWKVRGYENLLFIQGERFVQANPAFFMASNIETPSLAGLGVTNTPASSKALILASAVPLPPAIIAPA